VTEAALAASPGPWTVEDLTGLVEDGRRYEIVDGSLLVTPAPSLGHQGVAQRLATLLDSCCPPGWEAVQAPGLQLRREPTTRLLVPDVAVVRGEVLWGGADTVAADDVLLTVEVVSPSSEVTDRTTKPALYAAAGIAAYWRVELDDRLGITVVLHRLSGGDYVEDRLVHAGQTASIDWPLRCQLDPASLAGPGAAESQAHPNRLG
jgi:Uma2 family endonuclease